LREDLRGDTQMTSMFEKLSAGKSGSFIRPDTDAQARVSLAAGEADGAMTLGLPWVNAAYQTRRRPGVWVGSFSDSPTAEQQREARWEVTFLASRLVVWSPLAVNLFGKMKERPGAASGGHVLYRWIDEIEVGGTPSGLGITLLFDANPKDSFYLLELAALDFWGPEDAAKACGALADHLATYWASEQGDVPELNAALDRLRNHDWNGPEEEISLLKAGAKVTYLPER
jgi:hypothetical protein